MTLIPCYRCAEKDVFFRKQKKGEIISSRKSFVAGLAALVSTAAIGAPPSSNPVGEHAGVHQAMKMLQSALENSDRKITIKSIGINKAATADGPTTPSGTSCKVTGMVELAGKPVRVSATAATCEEAITIFRR